MPRLPPPSQALSDFNLALDLGFLTKNRTYTFFKPKFIMWVQPVGQPKPWALGACS